MSAFSFGNMFVLSLCRQLCPDRIPVTVGERLGDGSDGEVFTIPNDPDKVIKFSIIYQKMTRIKYSNVRKTLEFLSSNPLPHYARLYQYEYLGEFTRKTEYMAGGKQNMDLYYYIMERCYKLSEDEKKVFHTILSHEDREIVKDYSPEKVAEMLQGLGRGLDFDAEKITMFCDNIRNSPVSHQDIHPRNIMKDKVGSFKLIDFDRSNLENDNGKW